jgi:hypothetical protein
MRPRPKPQARAPPKRAEGWRPPMPETCTAELSPVPSPFPRATSSSGIKPMLQKSIRHFRSPFRTGESPKDAFPGSDGPSRPLLRRDRLDDRSTRLRRIEGFRGAFQRVLHERLNRGRVQGHRCGQHDSADGPPGSLEQMFWIRETGPAKEKEVDPTRIHGDRKDRLGGTLRRTESDHECVVVVVDEFDGPREAGPHLGEDRPRQGGDRRCELGDESLELFVGGEVRQGGSPPGLRWLRARRRAPCLAMRHP